MRSAIGIEVVEADASGLTDMQVRNLLRHYELLAEKACVEGADLGVRTWYAGLADGLRSVLSWRGGMLAAMEARLTGADGGDG